MRLEVQFPQPNKIVNSFIHSDIHIKVTANEGIKRTDDPQNKTPQSHKSFFPIVKNPTINRAAQIAVLELLRQPEGMYPS